MLSLVGKGIIYSGVQQILKQVSCILSKLVIILLLFLIDVTVHPQYILV